MAETDLAASPKVGTNIDRPVIDLYRPHITSGDCLIVTGYQDFLSSLAVLMREVKELNDPDADRGHPHSDIVRYRYGELSTVGKAEAGD